MNEAIFLMAFMLTAKQCGVDLRRIYGWFNTESACMAKEGYHRVFNADTGAYIGWVTPTGYVVRLD